MLIIHNASQLLTLAGGPQRGRCLGQLGMITNGAVAIDNGVIVAIGESSVLLEQFPTASAFDVQQHVVMPGFVDPHTHLVWAGDRAEEFDLRLQGKTYLEILEGGGGILSTVRATRQASLEALVRETHQRIWTAFFNGTTTAEVKTGYGLETAAELKQLDAIMHLHQEGPMDLIPTFLGAHAVPPAFKEHPQAYVDQLCEEMIPEVKHWWQESYPEKPLPFVDVFCERGAFDLAQTRQILETARSLGFRLKIHADEFENLGGAALAVELGAASADHLVKTSSADIDALGGSDTVAVSLPGTPFGLNEVDYTPAKAILEADGLLALATDTNPGTCWCESMQFMIALACRKLSLTPAQAIAAATINAAAAIDAADRVGSLEKGKQADILILGVQDYRHLGYRFGTNLVTYVIKQGRVYPVK